MPHPVGGAMGVPTFDIIDILTLRAGLLYFDLDCRLLLAWQGTQPTALQLFLSYSVEIYKCTNASELISWHKYQQESIRYLTEVLETLHAGETGLCFHNIGLLVTLTGLTNSVSTSNFSVMMKTCAYTSDKGKQIASLLSSHPGPPAENVWWLDSNSLSRRYPKQIQNGALMHTVHSLSLLIMILLAIWSSGWEAS